MLVEYAESEDLRTGCHTLEAVASIGSNQCDQARRVVVGLDRWRAGHRRDLRDRDASDGRVGDARPAGNDGHAHRGALAHETVGAEEMDLLVPEGLLGPARHDGWRRVHDVGRNSWSRQHLAGGRRPQGAGILEEPGKEARGHQRAELIGRCEDGPGRMSVEERTKALEAADAAPHVQRLLLAPRLEEPVLFARTWP